VTALVVVVLVETLLLLDENAELLYRLKAGYLSTFKKRESSEVINK